MFFGLKNSYGKVGPFVQSSTIFLFLGLYVHFISKVLSVTFSEVFMIGWWAFEGFILLQTTDNSEVLGHEGTEDVV